MSILFLGCRPMSAWALLDVSVELPKCAAFFAKLGKSYDYSMYDMIAVEFCVVVVDPVEVREYVSPC